jgi:Domain of unknown function (DUF4349)
MARARAARANLVAGGVLVALGSLAACSGGGGSSSDSAAEAGSVTSQDGGGAALDGAAPAVGAGGRVDQAVRTAPVQRKAVVRTGEITLTAPDLGRVRGEVDDLVAGLGGSVDREETTNDRRGRTERSTLVLRVPAGRFDTARTALARLGTLKASHVSAEDVTTEVIDVDERVQTLQTSLDDLQRFQRRATDVKDLLELEDKIAERQAELQSMQAQQTYLRDQTSLATITLHLSVPEKYVAPPDALDDAGFVAGLVAGWHGLENAVVVALTVVGALLPFALVALVLGVPVWLGLRTLVRRRRAVPTP